MRRIQRPNPGFTLIEVLVILAILAVLAGVLIPSIANQVIKSDVARVTSDVENLRTGIEAFIVDIKRYPGDIDDLVDAIDTGDDDLLGSDYPTGLTPKWTGPYIDAVVADGGVHNTGFGGEILDNFKLDSISGNDYLTFRITPLTQSDFYRIDAKIDTDTATGSGRLQWIVGDTAKYFALPVN